VWNPLVVDTIIWGFELKIHFLGFIAACIASLVHATFIYAMVTDDKVSPPRSSWFLWLLLDAIAFGSKLDDGMFDAMLLEYTVGTAAVALCTLRYGVHAWTHLETWCTIFVVASILVWTMASDPVLATISSMSGITVAALPIMRRVLNGEYEPLLAWCLGFIGSFVNTLDGQIMTSIWFMVIQGLVIAPVIYHYHWKEKPVPIPVAGSID
jgi:hypothetical protein